MPRRLLAVTALAALVAAPAAAPAAPRTVLAELAPKLPASSPAPPVVAGGLEVPRRLSEDVVLHPSDPLLATRQWNLGPAGISAFPLQLPLPVLLTAKPVTVAVIDSGIDAAVPDLAGAVIEQRSFVSGQAPRAGAHGTFVGGIVGARANGSGLASLGGIDLTGGAPLVRLLDLGVVNGEGDIEPRDEARAIRYAVARGARVINLSLGAPRNPNGSPRGCGGSTGACDGYSQTEAEAIRYAVSRGVLVVAAIGNSATTFADWPAALPHVVSVSAVDARRRPASFSNRDPIHNDLAAPGVGLVSTVPRSVTPSGLSSDAPGGAGGLLDEHGEARGTSFAAPHVTAAAALLLAINPTLTAHQVQEILRTTAQDVSVRGRDAATGAGALHVANAAHRVAFARALPPRDALEPNDDAAAQARKLVFGRARTVAATLSRYDDELDVYRVYLRRGQQFRATLRGPRGADFDLLLFRPGTRTILPLRSRRTLAGVVAGSLRPAAQEGLSLRATSTGTYELAVWAHTGVGPYRLALRR